MMRYDGDDQSISSGTDIVIFWTRTVITPEDKKI